MESENDEAQFKKKINEFFMQFDSDNDGKVSRDEWSDFFGRTFDTAIINKLNIGA